MLRGRNGPPPAPRDFEADFLVQGPTEEPRPSSGRLPPVSPFWSNGWGADRGALEPSRRPAATWSKRIVALVLASLAIQDAVLVSHAGAGAAERPPDASPGTSHENEAEALRTRVLSSVVGVRVLLPQPRITFSGRRRIKAEVGPTEGRGSGLIVDPAGIILTCAHVVGEATKARVFFEDDLEVEGQVLVADRTSDLALIKVAVDGLTAVDLGVHPSLVQGQVVHLASRPGGATPHYTEATLAAPGACHVGHSALEFFRQFFGGIEPGDSGGMLVDDRGAFIGVLSVGSPEGRLGYAIARELVVVALARLRAGPPVIWPWLGLGVETPAAARVGGGTVGGGEGMGARIWTVAGGSPGEAAGLKPGDLIVRLDGKPVEHFLTAMLTVAARPVGARFKVGIASAAGDPSENNIRILDLLSVARPLDPELQPLDLFERMTGIRLEPGRVGSSLADSGLFVQRAPSAPAHEHRSYSVGSRIAGLVPGFNVVRTLEEGRSDQETSIRTVEDLGEALRACRTGDRVTALIHWVKDGKSDTMLLTGDARRHPFL